VGLYIDFDKAAAEAAGMEFSTIRNGTTEEIEAAVEHKDDAEYVEWLSTEDPVIRVPGRDVFISVWINNGRAQVTANKWGNSYKALTEWLLSHLITWEEF